MNRLLIAIALCGPFIAANAQTVSISADTGNRSEAQLQRDDAREHDRFCLRETGSRLSHRSMRRNAKHGRDDDRDCAIFNGRVYTREDLDSTGAIDIADALRRLDTSIY